MAMHINAMPINTMSYYSTSDSTSGHFSSCSWLGQQHGNQLGVGYGNSVRPQYQPTLAAAVSASSGIVDCSVSQLEHGPVAVSANAQASVSQHYSVGVES